MRRLALVQRGRRPPAAGSRPFTGPVDCRVEAAEAQVPTRDLAVGVTRCWATSTSPSGGRPVWMQQDGYHTGLCCPRASVREALASGKAGRE